MMILNVQYNNLKFDEALQSLFALLKEEKKSVIFFLNADCLYKAQGDRAYSAILNSADLVLPDGIGIRMISKIFGYTMLDNCNGTDLLPLFIKKSSENGYSFFLLGGAHGIAEQAAHNIREQIPDATIVGTYSGYFDDNDTVTKMINDSGADILFVGMGAPLQEKWISKNRVVLNPRLCIGIGALLDYLSGRISRAPRWMRAVHLEWLWRIFIEPKRMFQRYIIDGSKLALIVIKYRMGWVKAG